MDSGDMTGVCFTIALIGGVTCAFIAPARQRRPAAWFVIGFLLPLVGLILILVLPPGESLNVAGIDLVPPPPSPDLQAKAAAIAREASLDALSKLAEMRERGLITDAEFEGKKRELLARV